MDSATAALSKANLTADSTRHAPAIAPAPGEPLPDIAWPTLALFAVLLLCGALSLASSLAGKQPLAMAIVLNAAISYAMFTVMHDASHHALSRRTWINSLVGQLSATCVSIFIAFSFFRFNHIEHHRSANEGMDHDPDAWCSNGPLWQLPLRWLTMDISYARFWARRMRYRPTREIAETLAVPALAVAGLIWAWSAGNLATVLLLIVLPQRIAVAFLAWAFDYLPHHDLTATARQNEYQATRNRVGMEWLLTPLLLSQNYHQIHHLHPSIPFYRYLAVWRRNETVYVHNGALLTTPMGKPIANDDYMTVRGIEPAAGHGRNFHTLTISRIEKVTPDSVAVTLDVPESLREAFSFLPGQHITVQHVVDGKRLRRSYSICVPAGSSSLRLGIKRVTGGVFSNYAVTQLSPGDTLDVLPPSGRFHATPTVGRVGQYGAIAAGSGITPILSIIASTLEIEADSHFALLFGNQSAGSIMFLDELERLQQRYPDRLDVRHFLATPEPGDRLEFTPGMIDEQAIARYLSEGRIRAITDWYMCGPSGLMTTARAALIASSGNCPPNIHQEIFISAATHDEPPEDATVQRTMPCEVHLISGGSATQFVMPPSRETVLDAAMRLRPDLPYSCLGGACGTCRAKVRSGSVSMAQNHALNDEEVASGYILCCQSRPTSASLHLDFDA